MMPESGKRVIFLGDGEFDGTGLQEAINSRRGSVGAGRLPINPVTDTRTVKYHPEFLE